MKRARLVWLLLPAVVVVPAVGLYVAQALYLRGLDRAVARMELLRAVYAVLDRYEQDYGRPPDSAAALLPYRAAYPDAIGAVERGEVVVVWGRPVRAARPAAVALAHERIDGRTRVRVLWSDGSVSGQDAADVPRLTGE